ncbi:hypothetical protein CHS0354_025742 [Potamilus streckersoni]|uniref:Ubiquitin-like domain-containing protein n=1 Tax=Potamilus streckersoni TaxID=2493646 RepID=A0AAE0VK12_9BIVA|nr:hypothetical protein CHS0354_025742 [Potamilus streckersoni]
MTWIEGVGDEVTIFFSIIIIVLVISLAWLSTGIRDIPLISVIIIELTTRRRWVPQISNQGTSPVQTLEDSTPTTNSSTGDISQADVGEIQFYDMQGNRVQDDDVVQEDHEGQVLQEESTESSGGQDNINLKEVQKGQNDSGKRSNKGIEQIGDAVEADEAKAESQENKMLKTELSETELRHRRMTFFEKANKLDKNESKSVDLCLDSKSANNSQTSVDNCSILENKPNLLTDFKKDSCSECDMKLASSENGSKPVISDSVSPVLVSDGDRPVLKNERQRLQSEEVEQPSTTPQSENVTTQLDGSIEENMINSDSSLIRIRLKYFNDSQRLVTAYPTDTVENFRRTHFSVELSENKLIRFIFNGQELRINSSTLQEYNVVDNSVIHCLISQNPSQTDATHTSDDDFSFDMGVFMFPLFGLLLAIIWYFRFTYRQFFNVTSTLSLGGITFLFLAALCASFRRRRGHEHLE